MTGVKLYTGCHGCGRSVSTDDGLCNKCRDKGVRGSKMSVFPTTEEIIERAAEMGRESAAATSGEFAHWTDTLTRLYACEEAVEWARKQPDAKAAWRRCKRADWMLWIAAKLADRKLVVLAACQCARYGQRYWANADDTRPMRAIETAEAWARGEATIDDVRNAAVYAVDYAVDYAAVYAVDYAAVYAAVYAAANAAYAADADADAADAADAAVYAAVYAADATRAKALADMARLVRKVIPFSALEVMP